MSKVQKLKSVDIDQLFLDVLLNDQVEFEIYRVEVRITLCKDRRISLFISKQYGDYHGSGSSYFTLDQAYSALRSGFNRIAGKPLPEINPPQERMWYAVTRFSNALPVGMFAEKPPLNEYMDDCYEMVEFKTPKPLNAMHIDWEDGYSFFRKDDLLYLTDAPLQNTVVFTYSELYE